MKKFQKKIKINLLQYAEIALNQFKYKKIKLIAFIIFTSLFIISIKLILNSNIVLFENKIINFINNAFNINLSSNTPLFILSTLFYILFIIGLSRPSNLNKITESIYNAGIVNYARETAIFIVNYKNPADKNTMIYKFFTNSTSLADWENNIEKIEILGFRVKDFKRIGTNKILLCLTKEDLGNPTPKLWNNDYLLKNSNEFKISLGIDSFGEQEIWNMSIIPHGFIGGESNSGKSVLLKCILGQALALNSEVYLADFKSGIDYEPIWHKYIPIASNLNDLFKLTEDLIGKYHFRTQLLYEAHVNNIDNYNKIMSKKMKHIIFAFDEVAQVYSINKKALSKEDQNLLAKIENNIDKLASLGRAVGIHLVFSTQRPSADLISGQTRTNLGYRICFRADDILSNIVLDNTNASKMIPKNARGIYISNINKKVSQGYWIDDFNKFFDENVKH